MNLYSVDILETVRSSISARMDPSGPCTIGALGSSLQSNNSDSGRVSSLFGGAPLPLSKRFKYQHANRFLK
jgi:hypothetical protein